MNILITSPSINTKNNVSGIANLTRLIVENNTNVRYTIFTAGKKDIEKHNIKWFFRQFSVIHLFNKAIREKDVFVVHINMPLENIAILRDFIFAFLCQLIHKPYILHLRGGSYNKNKSIPHVLKFLVRTSLKKAKQIIVLGHKEKKFVKEFYNIDENKIHVLPNCVKVPDNISKEIKESDTINFLFLGRIDKNKGLLEIVDSLASLPPYIRYMLNIAGNGSDKDWFLEYCNKMINNRFSYKGVVYGKKKEDLLRESLIFLLPSYYEGLPNALLEAMSYGVVPIVTPVGSILEVVKHNHNGIIVPLKDSDSIARSIKELIGNPSVFKKLSINAYKTINNNFSLNTYINKLNMIYESIM